MAIAAYIAWAVLDQIDQQIEYYEGRQEDQMADQLESTLFAAMERAAANPHSYASPRGLPRLYRRIIAKPFIVFYRINEEKGELTFYAYPPPITATTIGFDTSQEGW